MGDALKVSPAPGRLDSLRKLQDLRARSDVSPAALEQQVALTESELGVTPGQGRTAQQRADDLITRLSKTSFATAIDSKAQVELDGAAPSKPVRSGPGARHRERTPFAEGLSRARWDLREFYRSTHGVEAHHLAPTSGGSVANVQLAELSNGLKVVLRQIDASGSPVKVNNATHVFAMQLGADHLTLASSLFGADKDTKMIMARAPEGFAPANGVSPAWLEKISDETRVMGALIDLASDQQDRMPKNLMVNEKGEVRLIDPDSSWGSGAQWGNMSTFFAGNELPYHSKQDALTDLPPRAQQVVKEIAAAPLATLAADYGVSLDAARGFQQRMQRVAAGGLTQAIRETWSQRQWGVAELSAGSGFSKTSDAVAVRGPNHKPGRLATAPDVGFPPGPLDITFKLRAGELRGPPQSTLVTLEVYDHRSGKTVAKRDVRASDLPAAQWAEFHLPIDVPASRNLLSIRVSWSGAGDFDVGSISTR